VSGGKQVSEGERSYSVPENWRWVRLNALVNLYNGDRGKNYPSKKDYQVSGIPFINAGALSHGHLDESKFNFITERKYNELRAGKIMRGDSMPYLGKSALIRELPETCVFESNMMRISLNKDRVLPEFIIRYLNSPIGLAELRKNAKQAVNQASINQQDVKNVMVRLPFLDEQVEIVRILKDLQSKEQQAKEAAEAVLDQIDAMKKAILARAFRGELGTNDPAERPAHLPGGH